MGSSCCIASFVAKTWPATTVWLLWLLGLRWPDNTTSLVIMVQAAICVLPIKDAVQQGLSASLELRAVVVYRGTGMHPPPQDK